ncbi:formimidoylglutamate deiminase [Ensifer adhaerens]|uniref:formimidoylglutamate deiminase n=1 Tax=Ensifer adhaerens TaxID=106592 RepID=UPI001CC0BF98|nr:formimidoylglutamate deiminase [Ensifer adhaerens]MBZ7924915.1 formimidoylglutamate deiminase [Ensifer adhaerens]UAX95872.1 formimidoylglutamate deiminase [Ensifer adhaerens]UAY04786.1 formimidoylglutamate deiminase [Ensifer adhaerens]UAY10217.1 formimidoylglutamate deiminase [Ensifer adhaerens]
MTAPVQFEAVTHSVYADKVLLEGGWSRDVRITIADGRIKTIEVGVAALPEDERHALIVSGMPNLHSHAFQYGMAGLAERRGPSSDSFWSWREIMYKFALTMSPDQAEAVALRLYVEMLEAGFTRVGEFHYLHHDRDGTHYSNPAEMAVRIASAARRSGIGLTLLPVFYAHSTFGGVQPNEGQRRFIHDPDSFERLIAGCQRAIVDFDGAVLGVAPHSLRAATLEELATVSNLLPDAPVHIHIAEQTKEVEDCVAWSGKRPVDLLLDSQELSSRWCLIHATHMTDDETRRMAAAGAIAGLCPITEANLGDGTFNATVFGNAGGKFGIGSDSNVLIGIADELRQFEYSLRLQHRARNVLAEVEGSTGRALFDGAVEGGNIAMGRPQDGLKVGASADFVSLGLERLGHASDDALLDGWIFAGRTAPVDVWVRGVKQVMGGRHRLRDEAERGYAKALKELLA